MSKVKSSKTRVPSAPTDSSGQPPAFEYTADDLEQSYASLALFAGILAVVIASAGYACRLGFAENSRQGWAAYVGMSWFLVFFSFAVRQTLRSFGIALGNHWWTSHATLVLIALSLTAIFGVEDATVAHIACALFEVLGAITAAWLLFSRIRIARLSDTAILFGFAVFFGMFAVGASWGMGYQNPTFVEAILFGRAQIDTLYHATLANMLRTYGTPSTGLDGLPYVIYHFGSHWLFGRQCNLLNVSVIDFYNRGYAILFVPFGVFSLGTFALNMCPRWQTFREMSDRFESLRTGATLDPREQSRVIGTRFWFVLTAIYIGFLPYASGFLTTAALNCVIVSESYALAVAVSLLGIAAALDFFRNSYDNPDLWAGDRILGIIFLSAAMGAIGLLKISVMLVLVAAGAYLFLRVRPYLFRLAAAGTLLATSIVLVLCAFVFTANPEYGANNGFAPFGFLHGSIDPQWWSYFWLLYYTWCWLFLAARLYEAGIHTARDFGTAFREGRLLDLELVIAVAVFGSGPGILLSSDPNAHYFSDYQHWIAGGLLLAVLLRVRGRPSAGRWQDSSMDRSAISEGKSWSDRLTVTRMFAVVVVLAVAGTMVSNTLVLLNGTVSAALASRGMDWDRADTRAKLLDRGFVDLCRTAAGTAAQVERHFDTDKNVLFVLRSMDRLPLSEKRRSLLFIPKSNVHYWGLLHGPYSPKDGPFVATALSGIAMIDGLYNRPDWDAWTGYGFQHYPVPKKNGKQPPLDQYLPTLRQRCAAMGFTRLIVVTSDPNGISETRNYDCP